MPYTITWETWRDLDGCHEFMEIRKANMKETTMLAVKAVTWQY
jgi:hypothetical protein